jgi:hypothetical protein
MQKRDDLVAPGRGRGFGRGRGDARSFRERGLTPAIGAFLDYAPGVNTNISYLTIWSTKIKEYVNTICETRVGCIFGENGTVEAYHVYVEPTEEEPLPDTDSLTKKRNLKKWELAYSEYFKLSQKHEIEKRKVFSIMMGQMSDRSKNRIREIEIGITSIEKLDPRGLLSAIINTHMHDNRMGSMQNLCKAESAYTNLTMTPGDNLTQYHQKSVATIASLEECHRRLNNDIKVCMATEPQRAVRFI